MTQRSRWIWTCILLFGFTSLAAMVGRNLDLRYLRAKQAKNKSDLVAISTALEFYKIDHGTFPWAKTVSELRSQLEPKYIKALPTKDAWGNDFIYQTNGGDSYTVISLGEDHIRDLKPYNYGPIFHFAEDMVISAKGFVKFSEGG